MVKVGRTTEVFYEDRKFIHLDYDENTDISYLTIEKMMIKLSAIERAVLINALQEHTPEVEAITLTTSTGEIDAV